MLIIVKITDIINCLHYLNYSICIISTNIYNKAIGSLLWLFPWYKWQKLRQRENKWWVSHTSGDGRFTRQAGCLASAPHQHLHASYGWAGLLKWFLLLLLFGHLPLMKCFTMFLCFLCFFFLFFFNFFFNFIFKLYIIVLVLLCFCE